MLFDTLKLSCEKLCERDGEFKFQLQSFIKDHSSINGLVNMDTVKSLYDMILDHARLYACKTESDNAKADKISTEGWFNWRWQSEYPQADEWKYGRGYSGKGKAKGFSKGQGKFQPPADQSSGADKGKGQGGIKKEANKVLKVKEGAIRTQEPRK